MEKLAYNVRETAEVLGISRSHAYDLIKQGVIPVIKLGRRIVVPKVKLEQLISKQESQEESL